MPIAAYLEHQTGLKAEHLPSQVLLLSSTHMILFSRIILFLHIFLHSKDIILGSETMVANKVKSHPRQVYILLRDVNGLLTLKR